MAADVPTLNQNTTGTAANVTGTVAIANGGTGQTTRQAAMDALAGAVTAGQYLRGDGTDVVMSAIQAADVPTLNQNTTGTAANVTGTVAVANGGTGATTAANALTNLGAYPASNPNGYITNGAATAFPAGTVMLFAQTAAPTGWTKLTTHDNKALRVVSGTASSGGTVAFTTAFASQAVNGSIANTTAGGSVSVSGSVGNTTLSESQIPAHRHFVLRNEYSNQANQYTITVYSNNFFAGAGAGGFEYYTGNGHTSDANAGNTSASGGNGAHNHGFSGSGSFTGTAHNHTFTGTAINMAVQYVDVILASKA